MHFQNFYSKFFCSQNLISGAHIAAGTLAYNVQWLRLARSNGPNRECGPHHFTWACEQFQFPKMLCSLEYLMTKSVILRKRKEPMNFDLLNFLKLNCSTNTLPADSTRMQSDRTQNLKCTYQVKSNTYTMNAYTTKLGSHNYKFPMGWITTTMHAFLYLLCCDIMTAQDSHCLVTTQ
jgi:hypothetical protein